MKKLLLASVALATLASLPAFAADAIIEEPVLPAGFSWTGAYIGVQAGYGWGDARTTNFNGGGAINAQATPDPDGWLGGVYVGYNYQMSNNVVLGVDADFAWSGANSGFETALSGAGVPIPPNQHSVDIDYSAALRARLGYAFDRFLPYVAGGLAVARADFVYDHINDDAAFSDTLVGWTIGAGVEYAATDNLIVRAEYRYSDYGDGSASGHFPLFPAESTTYDLKSHDIRLGISYKF